ncbi:hypothetical protein [Desulfovibrio sp. UCD-KL4C]|uniref:hypothetical protein n=1 Tax=Desulfovibrio sp. UCD-KL4C TaxID=2578120 RepID=UPI0025BB344B|nr:hypothetical protein [Desulfovibrio sp. UCD-KL4C]
MLSNIFRHFFVGLGAMLYLFACPVLLYQYLGLMNHWPYIFISVIYDASGAWWLDVDKSSPVLWCALLFTVLAAVIYAISKRNDYVGYREAEVQSQSGF